MLLGNTGRDARGPIRYFGITSPGTERWGWHQSGQLQNFPGHDGRPTGSFKMGYPSGRKHPYSWGMPVKNGGMAAIFKAEGVATVVSEIEGGKNGVGTSDGVATTSATLQLVVSGLGTSDGVATVTGTIYASKAAVGTSDGVATVSGSTTALGWIMGSSDGVATTSIVSYATGKLSGSIAPAVELDASIFSTYLLDEQDVETGLTLRQALRLVTAASAGKISGASGTTVTIRNALADDKDRVVATVDSNGNRTAITYDLD
jgi:hypothetical protein